MYKPVTREDQDMLYAKNVDKKRQLEEGVKPYGNDETKEVIQAYRKWQRFDPEQKYQLRVAWEKYFSDVKETPIYGLVREQFKAAATGDWGRVKLLAEEAEEMKKQGALITLEKPSEVDPEVFERGSIIKSLHAIEENIALYEKSQELDESPTVWGDR